MKKVFGILFVLASIAINAQSEKSGLEKIIGEKTLPSISLFDIKGKKVDVADLGKTGKITMISFWATWCGPCKKELTNVNEVIDEWRTKYNMDLVAVSIDDSRNSAKVKSYADGQAWNFNILLDVNSDLKRSLNIQNVPFTLLVDQSGKIVFQKQGYIEGDESALEEVLAKLQK